MFPCGNNSCADCCSTSPFSNLFQYVQCSFFVWRMGPSIFSLPRSDNSHHGGLVSGLILPLLHRLGPFSSCGTSPQPVLGNSNATRVESLRRLRLSPGCTCWFNVVEQAPVSRAWLKPSDCSHTRNRWAAFVLARSCVLSWNHEGEKDVLALRRMVPLTPGRVSRQSTNGGQERWRDGVSVYGSLCRRGHRHLLWRTSHSALESGAAPKLRRRSTLEFSDPETGTSESRACLSRWPTTPRACEKRRRDGCYTGV